MADRPGTTARATMRGDATAELEMDGTTTAIVGASEADARQQIVERVLERARRDDAPVVISIEDRVGSGRLLVRPDGGVEPVAEPPAARRAPVSELRRFRAPEPAAYPDPITSKPPAADEVVVFEPEAAPATAGIDIFDVLDVEDDDTADVLDVEDDDTADVLDVEDAADGTAGEPDVEDDHSAEVRDVEADRGADVVGDPQGAGAAPVAASPAPAPAPRGRPPCTTSCRPLDRHRARRVRTRMRHRTRRSRPRTPRRVSSNPTTTVNPPGSAGARLSDASASVWRPARTNARCSPISTWCSGSGPVRARSPS